MSEQIQWLSILISFLSGIGLSLVGGLFAYLFQRRGEKQRLIEQARYDIFMKLLDLYGLYFWVYSAEVKKEEVKQSIKEKIWPLAWQISDKLRVADNLNHMEDILDVLFSNKYETAEQRYKAIENVLSKLTKTINPRFASAMNQVGGLNTKAIMENPMKRSNAPGFL